MRAPWLALAVLASLPFLFGQLCEAGDGVMYRNETDVDLSVHLVGRSPVELPARDTTGVGYIMSIDEPFRVRIVDGVGCLVFSLDTTLRELKADQDLTITIREEEAEKCASPDASPNAEGES